MGAGRIENLGDAGGDMAQREFDTTDRPLVVVITGALAGVGRATAQAFAELGSSIGLVVRGRDGLEAARRDRARYRFCDSLARCWQPRCRTIHTAREIALMLSHRKDERR